MFFFIFFRSYVSHFIFLKLNVSHFILLRSDVSQKWLSNLTILSDRRPISKKTGKLECTNPENAKKTFVRSQKNSGKLCDFKKSWEKCDKNWNRDKQKWKHRVQTKEVNKKICPISTKLGENLSDSDKIAKNTLSDLTKIAKIPCRKKKIRESTRSWTDRVLHSWADYYSVYLLLVCLGVEYPSIAGLAPG